MKYTIQINQVKAVEWKLNASQAAVYSWLLTLHSWADTKSIDGEVFYFASKTQAVKELPLVTDKVNTMTKHYKTLSERGLIEVKKLDGRDYVLLDKNLSKSWFTKNEDTSEVRKKILAVEEKNPSSSEEKNPTYKILQDNEDQYTKEKEKRATAPLVSSSRFKKSKVRFTQKHEGWFCKLWDAYEKVGKSEEARRAFKKLDEEEKIMLAKEAPNYIASTKHPDEPEGTEFIPNRKMLSSYINSRAFYTESE